MKKLFFLTAILFSGITFSQMGTNTPDPKATLDIVAKNTTGISTNIDGLLIPRLDRQRAQSMNSVPNSTLIFINNISNGTQTGTTINIDANGYYYFNGTVWIKLNPGSESDINIYNSNGSLTENRVVSQGANTLLFTGTTANAFSIDGPTFSVNAANKRVGINTVSPQSILAVANSSAGGLVDAFSAGVNNCGAPCGQGTARNIALFNSNGSNSKFASIDFIPSSNTTTGQQLSGATIIGVARDSDNGYAGLEFFTRNTVDFDARMAIEPEGNIGIGTSAPNENALLDVYATDKGFLPPRLTTVQRDAISPKPAGLLIYNTNQQEMQYWNGSVWIKFAYE